MRINRYLSSAGVCSRREADRLIDSGRITINGKTALIGTDVSDGDKVCFDGNAVRPVERKVVLAYYKPVGIVVTEDKREPDNIIDAIRYPRRVTYLGRLDKDSEGLILLSDDGDLNQSLMKGKNEHEKEYVVRVDHGITSDFLEAMRNGVYLPELDTATRKCRVNKLTDDSFSIILTQGLNRQIRRMCKELGYRVIRLKRIRIENILLGEMKPGELRELTEEEEKRLRESLTLKETDHE